MWYFFVCLFYKDSNRKNVAEQIPLQTYNQPTQIDTNQNLTFYMNPAGSGQILLNMSKMRVLVCLIVVVFSLI